MDGGWKGEENEREGSERKKNRNDGLVGAN